MPEDRTLILVLGMHRSGTSVLTRVLNLLGADVGRHLLQAQSDVNDRGFWEHEELVAINEALLCVLERSWYDFRPLPPRWCSGDQVSALMTRAVSFLETAFAGASLAAAKDPRLCLLLPFWKEAARLAGWRPVAVLATRAPEEVAASLCRRDPIGRAGARLLWLRYTRDSEEASRDLPRCRVDYASLLKDWKTALAGTQEALGVTWPQTMEAATEAVAAEIDPGLRHQHTASAEPAAGLERLASQAYRLLLSETLDRAALDRVWREYDALLEDCPALVSGLVEADGRLFAINNDLQSLGKEHQQALAVVADKDRQLEKLAGELEYAVSVVGERDEQLKYAQGVVEERDAQLQRLAGELEYAVSVVEKRDAQLNHPAVRLVRKLLFLDKE
ncbi:sulfotransferase family protein [Thiolapillus sp.]